MSFTTQNKYIFNMYRRLAIKFDQYLQHICMITDIDEDKYMFTTNSSIILSSKKFGIIFEMPSNISELFEGKVGVMNSEHVTAYYAFIIGTEQKIDYLEFKCDPIFSLITYPDNMPQLYIDDIPQNTIRADYLVKIKEIILKYRDFYEYLAKKYYCYSEKNYDDYCKDNCCCEDKKKCCKSDCCKKECIMTCKIECKTECRSKCDPCCKPCKPCDCCRPRNSCGCSKKNDCGNIWVVRK